MPRLCSRCRERVAQVGIVDSQSYNEATQRDVGFDYANRVSEQDLWTGLDGERYAYDSLGRLTMRFSGFYNTAQPTWCSDPDNGIACRPKASWVTETADTFAYDPAGNRIDRGGSYTVGNRITQFDGCAYSTDPDGNVTSRSGANCTRGGATFTWNAEGTLATIVMGTTTIAFNYDAWGHLVRKNVNGAAQSYFLWDGHDRLLAELDSSGTTKRAEYSYYPGMDRLHALVIGTAIYYAHADARGNVIALTDTNRNVPQWYGYDAWGTLTTGADTLSFNNYDRARWKGALLAVPELNLYYMRSRWYEGGTGRFLSEDPLGTAYLFAGNDPVNGADPTGLYDCALDVACPGSWGGVFSSGGAWNTFMSGGTQWGNDAMLDYVVAGSCSAFIQAAFGTCIDMRGYSVHDWKTLATLAWFLGSYGYSAEVTAGDSRYDKEGKCPFEHELGYHSASQYGHCGPRGAVDFIVPGQTGDRNNCIIAHEFDYWLYGGWFFGIYPDDWNIGWEHGKTTGHIHFASGNGSRWGPSGGSDSWNKC